MDANLTKLDSGIENKRNIVASTASTVCDFTSGVDRPNTFVVAIQANTAIDFTLPSVITGSEAFGFGVITDNDATAGRVLSWTKPIVWAGGVAPNRTTAANARDIYSFYYENGKFHGSLSWKDVK
jgi:hypothetical protein